MVISVRVPESGVCVHISAEDYVWFVYDVLYAVIYVRFNCFIVRGCAVSRKYINVCNSDVFSVVNMYVDYLKLCVVCINGRSMSVVLNVMLSITHPLSCATYRCTRL